MVQTHYEGLLSESSPPLVPRRKQMAQIIPRASHASALRHVAPQSSSVATAQCSFVPHSRPTVVFCFVSRFFFRIMSSVKNNVGRGLNIVLVNGELLIHPLDIPTVLLALGRRRGERIVLRSFSQHWLSCYHDPRGVKRGGLTGLWEQKV